MASAISWPSSRRLDEIDYRVGALSSNAALFTPQSRPRVFFVALAKPHFAALPGAAFFGDAPDADWSPPALLARAGLPARLSTADWVWWRCHRPPGAISISLISSKYCPGTRSWRTPAATQRLLALMAPGASRKIRDIEAAARSASAPFSAAPASTKTASSASGRKRGSTAWRAVCARRAAAVHARRCWRLGRIDPARACCRRARRRG